jgi:hypothetical protein
LEFFWKTAGWPSERLWAEFEGVDVRNCGVPVYVPRSFIICGSVSMISARNAAQWRTPDYWELATRLVSCCPERGKLCAYPRDFKVLSYPRF